MSLNTDDRLLGEKTHYYCSSSEDEENDDYVTKTESPNVMKSNADGTNADHVAANLTSNTGPKGVIEDWRKYKQLETEKREEQEYERIALSKKLSLTCRTHNEDEIEKEKDASVMKQLNEQFDELEESFLNEYRQKRLEEIRKLIETTPQFGKVLDLDRESFIEAIDVENPVVPVIIHIFEKSVKSCGTMNRCLDCLALEHLSAKFCRIAASEVKMSLNFAISGVPALLVYRNGELIGNFVRLGDELGEDFHSSDVEGFLIENGMLRDEHTTLSKVIRTSAAGINSDSDSD